MNEKDLKKLRKNLTKADILSIALRCKIAESSVRSILYGHRNNRKVLEAAIEKAERNKKKNIMLVQKIKAL